MLCYFRRDFRTVVFDLDPYFFHIIAISPKLDSTIRLAADCLDGILQKIDNHLGDEVFIRIQNYNTLLILM